MSGQGEGIPGDNWLQLLLQQILKNIESVVNAVENVQTQMREIQDVTTALSSESENRKQLCPINKNEISLMIQREFDKKELEKPKKRKDLFMYIITIVNLLIVILFSFLLYLK
jgi:hypothetical protein